MLLFTATVNQFPPELNNALLQTLFGEKPVLETPEEECFYSYSIIYFLSKNTYSNKMK